jgi:hypothetical protein
MTRERAKELQAAFNAFADGEPVRMRQKGSEMPWTTIHPPSSMFWYDDHNYEPAPPLVEGWVNVYPSGGMSQPFKSLNNAVMSARGDSVKTIFIREIENP